METVDRQRMVAGEGLAEGVERRGADVAEDDPDRPDRQLQQAALVMAGMGIANVGKWGRGSRGGFAHPSSLGTCPA